MQLITHNSTAMTKLRLLGLVAAALTAAALDLPSPAAAIQDYSHATGSDCSGFPQDPLGAIFDGFPSSGSPGDAETTAITYTGWNQGNSNGTLLMQVDGTHCVAEDHPSAASVATGSNPHKYVMKMWHGSTQTTGTPVREHLATTQPCNGKWIVDSQNNGYTEGRQALEAAIPLSYQRSESYWGNTQAFTQCEGPSVAGDGLVVDFHPPDFGFNELWTGAPDEDTLIAKSADAGAGLARMTVGWKNVQHYNATTGAVTYDWTAIKHTYDTFLSHGIHPIMIATSGGSAPTDTTDCFTLQNPANGRPSIVPDTDAARADWRDFIKRMAQQFPQDAGIEIWNEPNDAGSWGGCPPDPDVYFKLLVASVGGIQDSGTHVPLVTGGPAPRSSTDDQDHQYIAWTTWLTDVLTDALASPYGSAWAKANISAIGLHIYRNVHEIQVRPGHQYTDFAADSTDEYSDAQKLLSDPEIALNIPLWVTEAGTTTTTEDYTQPSPVYVGAKGPDPSTPAESLSTRETAQANDDLAIYNALRSAGSPVVIMNRMLDTYGTNVNANENGWGVFDVGMDLQHPQPLRCKLAYLYLAANRGESPSC